MQGTWLAYTVTVMGQGPKGAEGGRQLCTTALAQAVGRSRAWGEAAGDKGRGT